MNLTQILCAIHVFLNPGHLPPLSPTLGRDNVQSSIGNIFDVFLTFFCTKQVFFAFAIRARGLKHLVRVIPIFRGRKLNYTFSLNSCTVKYTECA